MKGKAPAIGLALLTFGVNGQDLPYSAAQPHGNSLSAPGIVDQRSPEYQRSAEHLAAARQALQKAISETQRAKESYPFPGFNYEAFLASLVSLQSQLGPLVDVEQRRLRYQTLTPDPVFITPPTAVDIPPQP